MEFKIREIAKEEYGILEDFLYEAIFVPEGVSAPPKTIIRQPELQLYVMDFGEKKDDIGLVAEVEAGIVGAVWPCIRAWDLKLSMKMRKNISWFALCDGERCFGR